MDMSNEDIRVVKQRLKGGRNTMEYHHNEAQWERDKARVRQYEADEPDDIITHPSQHDEFTMVMLDRPVPPDTNKFTFSQKRDILANALLVFGNRMCVALGTYFESQIVNDNWAVTSVVSCVIGGVKTDSTNGTGCDEKKGNDSDGVILLQHTPDIQYTITAVHSIRGEFVICLYMRSACLPNDVNKLRRCILCEVFGVNNELAKREVMHFFPGNGSYESLKNESSLYVDLFPSDSSSSSSRHTRLLTWMFDVGVVAAYFRVKDANSNNSLAILVQTRASATGNTRDIRCECALHTNASPPNDLKKVFISIADTSAPEYYEEETVRNWIGYSKTVRVPRQPVFKRECNTLRDFIAWACGLPIGSDNIIAIPDGFQSFTQSFKARIACLMVRLLDALS